MDVFFVMQQRDSGFLQVVSAYANEVLAEAAAERYTQQEIQRIKNYEASNDIVESHLDEDGRPKYARYYVDERPLLDTLPPLP
tara:strand:- start:2212 stop:2460 length:249 start_codon:yes stop_codon:yes gene_type:complete